MYNLQILFSAILPFIWTASAAPGLAARDQNRNFKTTTKSPPASQDPSPNKQAAHVLTLEQRTTGTATSAGYAQSLRQNSQVNGVYGTSDVTSVESGKPFQFQISIACRRLLTRISRLGIRDRY